MVLLLATSALTATLSAHEPVAVPDPARERIRGVVVSCPRWGPIWGGPEMAASLSEIGELGANWVAIHPYGWVKRDGAVRFDAARSLDFLARAVELTRAAGLEMFWKPHLGYWGQFSWRGEIGFGDDEEAWERFFRDYRAFIVDQAAFAEAHGIELFAAGTELDATVHREREWRGVLAAIRRVYTGRVLYAANWNQLERVPFWDAVDVIGVHAYYPLADPAAAAEGLPTSAALGAAWDRHLGPLQALSADRGKPVLFAEIGYNVNGRAAVEPWAYPVEDTPENRELRRRLMEVALERVEGEDFVEGMFWWKWMPGASHRRRNFALRDPEARAALARHWRRAEAPARPLATSDR